MTPEHGTLAPARLAELLRAESSLLSPAVTDPSPSGPAAVLAIADEELSLAVEAIHEGYLLHYGQPRVLTAAGDPDLDLLAGDRLYALGLERLAALGEMEAIATLAEVIAAGARAHAAGDPERAAEAWRAGTRAVARHVGRP